MPLLTEWRELVVDQPPSLLGLEETLLGGQSFSWTATSASSWIGVIGKSVVELRLNKEKLEWRTAGKTPFTEKELRAYLWLDPSYGDAIDSLPWRSDPILDRCMKALPGLRILRQPMDEILFVFLLSSVKSIPQIKEMKELVAKKYGDELDSNLSSFPGWQRLAEVSEEDLRSLKLGYRAKYVRAVAAFLAERSSWLDQVISQPYEDAKESLLTLPGVGPKGRRLLLALWGCKDAGFSCRHMDFEGHGNSLWFRRMDHDPTSPFRFQALRKTRWARSAISFFRGETGSP